MFTLLLQMRDLNHEHLTRFIGACLDPGHFAVLSEYCPKGSLLVRRLEL